MAPQDLVYKPIEAFAERGLEPRLVKLRYDFFEAKRKDLLAACKRARDIIIEQEHKERIHSKNGMTLQELSKLKNVPSGMIQAMQGDTVNQERVRVKHAQQLQLTWLSNMLRHQLTQTKHLESADKFMAAEQAGDIKKIRFRS